MKIKKSWLNIFIMLIVAIIAIFIIINKSKPVTSEEVARCIGENSVLYVQLGCTHCERQEALFGDNYQFLNTIDCFYERAKCADITSTPTWLIKGEKYIGVQSIERLQELTQC